MSKTEEGRVTLVGLSDSMVLGKGGAIGEGTSECQQIKEVGVRGQSAHPVERGKHEIAPAEASGRGGAGVSVIVLCNGDRCQDISNVARGRQIRSRWRRKVDVLLVVAWRSDRY